MGTDCTEASPGIKIFQGLSTDHKRNNYYFSFDDITNCSNLEKYSFAHELQLQQACKLTTLAYFAFLFLDPMANLSLYFGRDSAENIL